jgi:hypothetical protein
LRAFWLPRHPAGSRTGPAEHGLRQPAERIDAPPIGAMRDNRINRSFTISDYECGRSPFSS